MASNASEERKRRLWAHGANIVFTDPMLGYDETLREVRRRYERDPLKYFYCNQYANMHNPQAHYDTTAVEILEQAPEITHLVAGVGTGGTISGIGKRLKDEGSSVEIVLINFDEWPGVEGLKPLGQGHIVPDTFDQDIVDREITIDVDEGYKMSRMLASHGIFTGQSSGAYLAGAHKLSKDLNGGHVVTLFNDIGERYFSTGMWDRKPDSG